MKKRILTFLFSILLGITVFAQTPQSFNYQAVLRDASGNILANQDVSIGLAILQGSVSGTEVFSEIQNTTTNSFGLTNLKIGSVNTTGFQTIDWADGPYFIQISVDGNIMGTSQLLSVPYALHAGSVDNDKVDDADADSTNELQDITLSGSQLSISRGSTVDLSSAIGLSDTSATNELQDISLSGTQLSISLGSTVDLSVLQDGTGSDNQTLTLYNNKYLQISNGNTLTLPFISNEQDGDKTNEIQTISRTGLTVTLDKNGGTFQDSVLTENDVDNMVSNNGYQLAADDGDTDDTNELQTISRSGLTVTLDKNGGTFQDSVLTETDVDNMVSDNGFQLAVDDGDTDDTNEIQTISRTGLTVTLDKNGGTFQDSVLTETDVDNMVSDNGFQLAADDGDTDDTNELISAIALNGTTLEITDSAGVHSVDLDTLRNVLHDADNDTKIQVEKNPDEDIIRIDLAGNETLAMNNSSGTVLNLPTSDDNSSLKIKNSNGNVVFGVDGRGLMNGDGSGLSNVKPIIGYSGGDYRMQVTSTDPYNPTLLKSVSLIVNGPGTIIVQATGYADWESINCDYYRMSVVPSTIATGTVSFGDNYFNYLMIDTDKGCADSSDQYSPFAYSRCFTVNSPGTYQYNLWADRVFTSSLVEMGDINMQAMYFPTGGTGSVVLKGAELSATKNEEDEATYYDPSLPRNLDGSLKTGDTSPKTNLMAPTSDSSEKLDKLNQLIQDNERLKAEIIQIKKFIGIKEEDNIE